MTEVRLLVAVEVVLDDTAGFFSGVALVLTTGTAIGPVGLR
jgi:hypothetical protein